MEWCWQVSDSAKHKIHSRGYLFSYLYNLFRFSYYRNEIYFTPEEVVIPKEFIELFVTLPLDFQRNIMNQIWNKGRVYRQVIVDNNTLVLPLFLSFLFYVYRRLKNVTSEVVPPVDGNWQGTKLSRIEYKFVFAKQNLRATPFIHDFMDQNPLYFNSADFRIICL